MRYQHTSTHRGMLWRSSAKWSEGIKDFVPRDHEHLLQEPQVINRICYKKCLQDENLFLSAMHHAGTFLQGTSRQASPFFSCSTVMEDNVLPSHESTFTAIWYDWRWNPSIEWFMFFPFQ
jgi:hypothetical protein